MAVLTELNDTNATCPLTLLWDQSIRNNQRPVLYVCLLATVTHSIFWLQLVFYPAVRKKSMQWLYAYLITDILLLFRFYFVFIVHTLSKECTPNPNWSRFVCYFEAMFDNYLNTLEAYILLALNICRYIQIVHNRDVYTIYVRSLIGAHLAIYVTPLIGFLIQISLGWAQFKVFIGGSCDVAYTNTFIQIFNLMCGIVFPILLNIIVIYFNVRHVRLTCRLHRAQHRVSASEKYHRSLAMQFLVFYTVWLLLWSPNLIIYQFTSGLSNATRIASLLNFIEIALDPIIIAALDVRFQKLWHNLWTRLTGTVVSNQMNQIKIVPIATNANGL